MLEAVWVLYKRSKTDDFEAEGNLESLLREAVDFGVRLLVEEIFGGVMKAFSLL